MAAMMPTTSTMLALALLACPADQGKAQTVTVSEARTDANGFLVHEVQSPYQAGKTEIRILLPDKVEKDKRDPVVYVLPVEAGKESRYGDGLVEVKKNDLHNKLRAVFVAPTFSHLPWYANHPMKADISQETYFVTVVVPFIEKTYPVRAEASGRLLLGFSKSGWGAFSLLLRHPDLFGKAAAWGAPLMMEQPNRFGMGDVFGTQENFENYQAVQPSRQESSRYTKTIVAVPVRRHKIATVGRTHRLRRIGERAATQHSAY
jgi:S-formylglutathione hydrolase FrmB